MERYNIFNLIHKGLRASLYQTALQLQQADFTNATETEAAMERVREIILLFKGHAEKEDHFILPAIVDYEPGVVAAFEDEHVEDEQLAEGLNACLDQLADAKTLLEQLVTGRELNQAFVAFTVFNLRHMAREEECINPILWRYYSDEELQQLSHRVVKSIEPWINDFYMTWMIRGVNDDEAQAWFNGMHATMPEVVFRSVMQKAEKELSPARYRKLSKPFSAPAVQA